MSFKTLFDKARQTNSIANKSAAEIGNEVESPQYHEQDIINESRFIPNVDYSEPGNFARYGSAEEYYAQSIVRIYDTYPYDGSLKERLEWENDSTYLDLHIFNNLYPRTNGYVIISSGSWGTTTMPSSYDGYGLPSNAEFISFLGGPHPNPAGMSPTAGQFTGSNYYNASNNRESNLKYDLQNKGITVEFWLKKDNFITALTEKEVIFDLWNGEQYGTPDYGRLTVELTGAANGLNPVRITALSGTTGVIRASVAAATFTTASVADGNWHHYAVSLLSSSTGIETRFYFDGNLNNSNTTGSSGLNEVTAGGLRAYLGAAITTPPATAAPARSGKLSGSLDEFRYWKVQRSSKDIGRYWFDQVGGGTNNDPEPFSDTQETVNTNLGVYFKFNEGITGVAATDSSVLDYSGRISNGAWTGYTAGSRQTGSAIVLSDAAIKEFKDPIIYSFNPEVEALQATLALSGSDHDATNNASIYNSIPAWITEEDAEAQYNTRYLTQIMGSYFDTLHMQIHQMNKLKDVRYVSGSDKQLPFTGRLLGSNGFVAPDIFIDADVLEKLADRSEDLLYEKSLSEVKNIIYQNVYNNLSYIYKSKGTEKAFRNLIRCFGIDDELVKLSMYANNTEYQYRENRRTILVNDRAVNFNSPVNKNAVVFSLSSSASPHGATGFIPSSTALSAGFAYTLENDIIFPKKPDETSVTYFDTNAISSSIFGVHGATTNESETSWPVNDSVNFQVYTVRDELTSPNVKFVLTGTNGGHFPSIETDLYEDVYDNTRWNISVRVKPENYPLAYFADEAANGNYTVVFSGIEVRSGEVVNTFELSGTVSPPDDSFITGSRRVFVGAHRTNFTGSVLQTSDVEIDACRFWLDYVDNVALKQHTLDSENYGALRPSDYAYPFDATASYGDIKKSETLVFNWEFSQNTGSNTSGQFIVADESSGSALPAPRFGALGKILAPQYTGLGYNFAASSTDAIKKEFIVVSRLNDLETIAPSEMIEVLRSEDQILFKIDSRPVDYYFAFEKSMAKVISEEMVNMFGTLRDFNNMVGQPVNRFRQEYKTLNFMRRAFFEKVGNSQIDFDHFYEFYKWFDSSLSYMLGQLVPASADFAENIRTIVENTALERNKYRSPFPFVDSEGLVFETAISSNVDYGDAISSPDDDPQGTGFYPAHAPTLRQVGLSERANIKKWKYVHHPPNANQQEKYLWWKNYAPRDAPGLNTNAAAAAARGPILNAIRNGMQQESARPYRFSFTGTKVLGGVGAKQNKNVNFMFAATAPFGPLVKLTNIPENIMLSFDTDVEQLIDTTDVFYPTYKQRLGFGINPKINVNTDIVDKRDGNSITTFSLYSQAKPQSVYEEEISSSYKPGVTITNLHHDYVDSTDIPLQGPFTEKFVGGRQFRHTEINAGSDTRTTRFEGYRIELGVATGTGHAGSLGIVPGNYPFADTPAGAAPDGFLPELAVVSRFREETAKRPVNIKNILMTTEPLDTRMSGTILHSRIGNYTKNYQVIQTSGRIMNDPFFNDQSFDFALYPETSATRGRFLGVLNNASTANPGGTLNYALPSRTGANSNQTILVNRFSSPGGYEVNSRGYMDPAHEELSVYNALPYRNRGVIDYGMSGSASADPSITQALHVVDQLLHPRGLDQRATLHCGPFGIDAAYGSITATSTRVDGGQGYSVTPSWHKTNRNAKAVIRSSSAGYYKGVIYDNLFVQHQIPRSEQQYTWITGSLKYGETIYGLDAPVCLTSSAMDKLIVSGSDDSNLLFIPLNIQTNDPVTASTHTLGYPLNTQINIRADGTIISRPGYVNVDYWGSPVFGNPDNWVNNLITTRNGPYGWPTWKQIRTGETKVARTLRENNLIGVLVPPPMLKKTISGRTIQYVRGKKSNEFIDYIEQPISSRHYPVTICVEDNTEDSNTNNNILMNITYGNLLDYFSHPELNARLNIPEPDLYNNALNSVFEYITSSAMSVVIGYSERIYPKEINAYRNIVRRRTQFTIDDIWSPNRSTRSLNGGGATGTANSQGVTINSSSTWPLDGHLDFNTVASTAPTSSDGSGELLNSYSRYGSASVATVRPAATYAWRIPVGSSSVNNNPVLAGDAKWEAATQSGKDPYENYEDYSEKIARIGKDHSIVPEFRISPLIENYVEANNSDFLADVNNILELTGASLSNSSEASFFTTYTNADFLKYFSVVDKEINDKRSGNLKIRRDKVSLKCSALLKFLPYKGFYPAERTIELSTLFSQSYADTAFINIGSGGGKRQQIYRALLEPFFSPGIMFNTIKSGIGVSTCVLANTGSDAKTVLANQALATVNGAATTLFEGTVKLKTIAKFSTTLSGLNTNNGYYLQRLPFETLYKPRVYLSKDYITGSGAIYDNGVIDSSTGAEDKFDSGGSGPNYVLLNGGKKLYEMAIDNFLCETTNFFLDRPATFESKREDQFGAVVSGSTYTMQLKMFRTLDQNMIVTPGSFNLYSRESAFGFPMGGGSGGANNTYGHLTPPYYSGSATTTFVYTAATSGIPTLSEILANTVITQARSLSAYESARVTTLSEEASFMYNDSCFNLTDYYNEVPKGTTQQSSRWLIQSKFETPVLNFANVNYTKPAASSVEPGLTPAEDISIRGMWHQYGHLPTGSQEGIFALIEKGDQNTIDGGTNISLADIVGMPSGTPLRVGKVKTENVLEEAVVVVPFKTVKNRRKFFQFNRKSKQSDSYKKLVTLMDKYIFPPKFDFTRHESVKPIQMYAFEFAASTTQQDIADMWQNLPPNISDTFVHKEVTVEEDELMKALLENSPEIQWMVFKVKKRAKRNYEKYRRSLVTADTSAFPETIGDYSYNWPYDYFSLVELVKIDESVQYISSDLTDMPDSKIQIVGDVNVNVTNPVPVINMPEGFDR
tara:strand:- start:3993 stop:12617 length:8625 start_codon:yes stop_codon:yes gene_type:complete